MPADLGPRVSAVVVTYRSAAHLPALLPELAAAADEVVVVDNASDDGSADVAERLLPDADVVRCERNRGFAAGVNTAIARTSGDLLLLCNPDVVLDKSVVTGLVEASRRHPCDVLGPLVRLPGGRVQPTRTGRPSLWNVLGEQLVVPDSARPGTWPARLWSRWQPYDHEEQGPLLSGVCLLLPRALWQKTGPFDDRYFLYWEEIDWQLRAHATGARSVLVPSVEVVHARSASTGPQDERRAQLFAASTREFVRRWLPGWRTPVALALLVAGQATRVIAWSLPPARLRPEAGARRAQHMATLRGLLAVRAQVQEELPPRPSRPPRRAGQRRVWLVEMFAQGGIARYAADVADILGEADTFDVVVATTSSGPAPGLSVPHEVWFRTGTGDGNRSDHGLGGQLPGTLARALAGAGALARLPRRVRRGDIAWIPLGVRPSFEALLAASLRACGAMVVATLHNRAPHGRPRAGRLVLAAARRAHRVVVHTVALQSWAQEQGLDVERLPFPPPREDGAGPAGRHTRESLGAGPDDLLVVLAGNLYRYKGVDVLLDAVAQLQTREARPLEAGRLRFVLAGQQEPGTDLRHEIARRGLSSRVHALIGYLEPGVFVDVLDAADVIALTYRRVDHSGVGALAVARGLPAVASDLPGLHELLGDAALYASPGDPEALADALADVPSSLDRLRQAAAALAPNEDRWAAYRSMIQRLAQQVAPLQGRSPQ